MRLLILLSASLALAAQPPTDEARAAQALKQSFELSGRARIQKLDEAQRLYERIAAANPENAEAHYSLGMIAWSRVHTALDGVERQIYADKGVNFLSHAMGPVRDTNLRLNLLTLYSRVIEDGLRNLERALELRPDDYDAMIRMGMLIKERALLRDNPGDYETDDRLGDAWLAKPRQRKAQIAQAINVRLEKVRVVKRVEPVYPPAARAARIQGVAEFEVVIDTAGRVIDLTVVGGPSELIPAAKEAVWQWVFTPTLLNSEPIPIRTRIGIRFSLTQ